MKDDRYQFQKWYVKLWRMRYYLRVPFTAFRIWRQIDDVERGHAWDIAIGLAQGPMKYYYWMGELDD